MNLADYYKIYNKNESESFASLSPSLKLENIKFDTGTQIRGFASFDADQCWQNVVRKWVYSRADRKRHSEVRVGVEVLRGGGLEIQEWAFGVTFDSFLGNLIIL